MSDLRTQLIDAMAPRLQRKLAESVFDLDLWPVLQEAMRSGEILVARKSPQQKPVHFAIINWLEVVGWTVEKVKAVESTVSKAELLKLVYDLDAQCRIALRDAKQVDIMLNG